VQVLGNFISHSITTNSDIEMPEEVKKVLQQIVHFEQQQIQKKNRTRPMFVDRKIGKSMSVNSHLTLALNVLEEANENSESSTKTSKKFFGNTFESIRQNKAHFATLRLNCDESGHKTDASDKCYDVDSGVTTPSEFPTEFSETSAHPLSNEVNNFVRFNGTMQLKTIRSVQSSRNPANCTKPSINVVDNSEAKS
jgi:TBC1 domain family member 4